MRKFAIYLFSILLLSTAVVRASSTVSSGKKRPTLKLIGAEKTEKIEVEEERTSSDQLNNNELIKLITS